MTWKRSLWALGCFPAGKSRLAGTARLSSLVAQSRGWLGAAKKWSDSEIISHFYSLNS